MTTLIEQIKEGADQNEILASIRTYAASNSLNATEEETVLTALHYAISTENLEAIGHIIASGESIDWSIQDLNGNTSLHYLAKIENEEILNYFRGKIKLPENILNIQNQQMQTPAFLAAQNGKTQALRMFGEAGADLEILDCSGISPLFAATSNNHQACTDYIVENIYDQPHIFGAIHDLIKTFPNYEVSGEGLKKYEFEPHDLLQKYASHQLGFDTRLSGEEQSGSSSTITFPWIVNNLNMYITKKASQGNKTVAKRFKQIQEILNFNLQYHENPIELGKQLFHRVRDDNQTIAFASGWEGHAISIIIKDNQLIVCNRGDGADYDEKSVYGIVAYQLNKPITQEQLELLTTANAFPDELSFNNHLISLVSTPPAPVQPLYKVPASGQKYGTCSFVNLKHAVKALWILLEQEQQPSIDLEEIINKANVQYDDFKDLCRDFVVEDIIAQIKNAKSTREYHLASLMMQVISKHPGLVTPNGSEMQRAKALLENLPQYYQAIFIFTNMKLSIQLNPELTLSMFSDEYFIGLKDQCDVRENVEEKTNFTRAFLFAIKQNYVDIAKSLYQLDLVDLNLVESSEISEVDAQLLQEITRTASKEEIEKAVGQKRQSMMFSGSGTEENTNDQDKPTLDDTSAPTGPSGKAP